MPTRKRPQARATSAATSTYSKKPATLARGTSGAKQGKDGGKRLTKPKRANSLSQHPIYRALLDIGSKEKSIKPSALRKYAALVDSPEVRRRAGSTTDLDERANHASGALKAAVDAIADPTRRHIAQAALCTEPIYVGVRLAKRKEDLENCREKITEDMFRYHRRLAFEDIVRFLEAPERLEIGTNEIDHTFTLRKAVLEPVMGKSVDDFGLTHLGLDAARLHYLCVASLFAIDLEVVLRRANIHWQRWNRFDSRQGEGLHEKRGFKEYVLEHYLWLVYQGVKAARPELGLLPQPLRRRVTVLIQIVGDSSPVGPHAISDAEAQELTMELVKARAYPDSHFETPGDLHRVWRRWYRKNCQPLYSQDSALLPIASASGTLVWWLTRELTLTLPVHEEARRTAHRALATYLEPLDLDEPLFHRLSLRERADAYFDMKSSELTNRGLFLTEPKQ